MCDISDEISGYVNEMNKVISKVFYYNDNDADMLLNYYNNNIGIIKSISYYINLDNFQDNELKDKFNSVVESCNTRIQNSKT